MKQIPIRDQGLVGTFFDTGAESVVLILTGAGGGHSERRAQKLSSYGFNTFSLAYFGIEPLPRNLNSIPIEYFERALKWMGEKYCKVGLWGISRGGELSLLLGTLFPHHIQAIATHVPSSIVLEAVGDRAPAWVYQNHPLIPSSPLFSLPSERGLIEGDPISMTPFFLEWMKDQKMISQATIPVEKIQCPLLLVSGEDDQMWPSSLFCKQIENRLRAHNSSISYIHHCYPDAGHSFEKEPPIEYHPHIKRWLNHGGTPKGNSLAAQDSWNKTVDFFRCCDFF